MRRDLYLLSMSEREEVSYLLLQLRQELVEKCDSTVWIRVCHVNFVLLLKCEHDIIFVVDANERS